MSHSWIYARVSTAEQANDGSSLPTQDRLCRRMAERIGVPLGEATNYDNPGVFADPGVSAWKVPILERPGFGQLWSVAQPGDKIISLCLDRQFRSVKDFCNTWPVFEARNLSPVFVRENIDMSTPTGVLIGTMTATFAQYKSHLISHRVKEAHLIRSEMMRDGKEYPALTKGTLPRVQQKPDGALARYAVSQLEEPVVTAGRVWGYVRVSTSSQDVSAQSRAVDKLMVCMELDGYELAESYVDHGVSAFRNDWAKRKAGSQLLARVRPGDVIVVTHADRIFRSVADMAVTMRKLYDRGIHVVTNCGIDTRTMAGRQLMQVVAMMASWESDINSWRVKLARANRRQVYGKWSNPSELPSYMERVDLPGGLWTAQPRLRWIEECQIASRLHAEGKSHPQVSDLMEDMLQSQADRPRLPTGCFERRGVTRSLSRWNSSDKMERLQDWFEVNPNLFSRSNKLWRRDWGFRKCQRDIRILPRVMQMAEEMGVLA